MRNLIPLLFIVVFSSAFAEEVSVAEQNFCIKALKGIAEHYIEQNSTPEDEAKWLKKFNARTEQAMKDRETLDENKYANESVTDWIMSRRNFTFEEISEKDKLMACRYFLLYCNNGFEFPSWAKNGFNYASVQIALEFIKNKAK